VNDWRGLVAHAVERAEIDGGVRLRFAPDAAIATRVATLAAAEQSCCAFFEFTVRIAARGTELEVRAPIDAQGLIAALFTAD
jgi:hypothetical protein